MRVRKWSISDKVVDKYIMTVFENPCEQRYGGAFFHLSLEFEPEHFGSHPCYQCRKIETRLGGL